VEPAALILSLALLSVGGAVVDERTQLPACSPERTPPRPPGAVLRLFELHKDRNPQNVLVIHTYADASCRLIGSVERKERLVDMYWRMDADAPGACYKPTDPRIKSETLRSLDVKSLSSDRRRFRLEITQLDQLDHDLPTRELEITLERTDSGCRAEARLPLDASGGAVLRLRKINARGEYALGVPLRTVEELELVGVDADGKPLRRRYHSQKAASTPH
jgi:hypothetical protein